MYLNPEIKSTKTQLTIITLIVFIGFIGVALPFPIFAPMFLIPKVGGIVSFDVNQFWRGIYLGLALAVYPLGQFIGSPIIGILSDSYGRKSTLIVCLLGTAIGYAFTAFAVYHNHLLLLILSRFYTGFLEGNVAIARAMAADLVGLSRHKSFGMIGMATSLGYIFGPLLGGIFADNNIVSWFSYQMPFYLAVFLSLFACIISYLFINENNNRQEIQMIDKSGLVKQFKNIAKHPFMISSFLTLFLLSLAVDTYYEFFPVYLTGIWKVTSSSIGIFTIFLAIAVTLGDLFLVPYMEKFKNDLRTIFYFSISLAILIFSITLSNNYYVLYIIFIFIGFSIPTTTTTMVIYLSTLSKTSSHGSTMGLATSARALGDSITCLIGGLLVGLSYSIPLYLSVGFTILSILMTIKLKKLQKI